MGDLLTHYKKYLTSLDNVLGNVPESQLAKLLEILMDAEAQRRTVFIAGNGGNASTASHWATDLGKGLRHKAKLSIKALSLADNTSWISAVANDIDYDEIFSDQLKAHGNRHDVLICLSASGESKNIINALRQAKAMEITSFSIVGFDGGKAKEISDYSIHLQAPRGQYGIVEDAQLIINHFICDYLADQGR